MTTEIKWVYLAALVDGEGCISIWRTKSRATDYWVSKKTYKSFNLRIQVYNTNTTLMEYLVTQFGGTFKPRKKMQKETHKISYSWRPKGEGHTKEILTNILPHLVIKLEQAEIALEYIALPHHSPDKREILYQRMRVLNAKGKNRRD